METAVVARGILYHQPRLGSGSSERAEWLALLHALRVAREIGARDVVLIGDSLSVIHQVRGVARCRGAAERAALEAVRAQFGHFTRVRLRHVPRSRNLAGSALARMRDGAGGPV